MIRQVPFCAAALLGIGLATFLAGCGNSNTVPSNTPPSASEIQAQQQAGEQAAANAKVQGEAAKAAAAARHQAGTSH